MTRLTSRSSNRAGSLPPSRPLGESVEHPFLQVKELIRERRRLALVYQRSQSGLDRGHLDNIDRKLASHNIDIPAIQRSVAQRKT